MHIWKTSSNCLQTRVPLQGFAAFVRFAPKVLEVSSSAQLYGSCCCCSRVVAVSCKAHGSKQCQGVFKVSFRGTHVAGKKVEVKEDSVSTYPSKEATCDPNWVGPSGIVGSFEV